MLLTQLEYFVALAREHHFGRAAAVSHVTQSALSEAIRKLETELGTSLVNRGRTFEGLTAEGERVLVWARKMLDDHRALIDEVITQPRALTGVVRIGVIPSATVDAADLIASLADAHPLLRAHCETSLSSEQIIDRIHRFELEAGIVHPSAEGSDSVMITPLSERPLVVVASADLLGSDLTELTAHDLAKLPLCLLHPGMRGRQVLDGQLADHGIALRPQVETDSIDQLLALARTGRWASVVPGNALPSQGSAGLRVLDLVAPSVSLSIVLATRAEQPRPAITRAILRAAGLAAPAPRVQVR